METITILGIPSWYENKEEAIKIIEEENELPTKTSLKLKKFEIGDADHVLKILSNYFKKFTVHPLFSKEEIIHWFTPIEDVIYSYLVLVCLFPYLVLIIFRIKKIIFVILLPSLSFLHQF